MQELLSPNLDIKDLSKEDLEVLLGHYLILCKLFQSPVPEKGLYAYNIMKTKGCSFIKDLETHTYDWMYSSTGADLLKAARKTRSAFFRYEERLP